MRSVRRLANVFLALVFSVVMFVALPGRMFAQSQVEESQPWSWPDKASNLKVLPPDFSAQRLQSVMRGFSRTLGVRCSHCHVGEEGAPLNTYDFSSDANPKKDVTRVMLKMLGDITERLDTIEPTGNRVNMWCHTCHRGRPRPMTVAEELLEVFEKSGLKKTLSHYRSLHERFYGKGAYNFNENALNALGYKVLEAGDREGAIETFKLNAERFPKSANVHDSLGEAYLVNGNKRAAIRSYKKSLRLNPQNQNAREKLKKLGAS